jgi:hypothetical protein
MARMLKVKIAGFLVKRGQEGATRTKLLHKYAATAAELDRAVALLIAEGEIVEWVQTTNGRPSTTYYNAEAVKDLTPPQDQAMPVATEPIPSDPSTRSSLCKVCGVAIRWPVEGRPYSYCSRACRRAARDGGVPMKEFLMRATDPRVFAEVAVLLVMADLIMRGYRVARHWFISGPRIVVTDELSGIGCVDVVPVGLDGHFPDPNDFETMAGVYHDGRIVYAGRNPFVEPPSALEPVEQEADVVPPEEAAPVETPVLGVPEDPEDAYTADE